MIEETQTEVVAGGAREALQPADVEAAVAAVVIIQPKLPPCVGD